MKANQLQPNPKNPRTITDKKLAALKKTLLEFGDLGGVVYNRRSKQLVGGHQRSKLFADAVITIERTHKVPTKTGTLAEGFIEFGGERFAYREVLWDELTEKAANVAANKGAGEWDTGILTEWLRELDSVNFDMDLTLFDAGEIGDLLATPKPNTGTTGSLNERFVVPPFSILDTRQGYWQERRAEWLAKTGNLTTSKEQVLSGGVNCINTINEGSSNFDPVLAEIMYKWFCPEGGTVLDPFGGEQTKGVVAGELGYRYVATELRAEQVAVNRKATAAYPNVIYHHGDATNIATLVPKVPYDFCFTSPPYYDLEVYSKTDMSALPSYAEFMRQYERVFKQCYELLAPNSFCAVKVAEIRDRKTGVYRNFVGDNVALFTRLGFKYYNEFTLLNAAGTAQIRATRYMNGGRKIVKLHQNVLVFYKGEVANIKTKFKNIELPEVMADDGEPTTTGE